MRGFKAEVAREPPQSAASQARWHLELRLKGSDVVQRIGNGLLVRPEWRDVVTSLPRTSMRVRVRRPMKL